MANPFNQVCTIRTNYFRLTFSYPFAGEQNYCSYMVWDRYYWEGGSVKITRAKQKAFIKNLRLRVKREQRVRKMRKDYCR